MLSEKGALIAINFGHYKTYLVSASIVTCLHLIRQHLYACGFKQSANATWL